MKNKFPFAVAALSTVGVFSACSLCANSTNAAIIYPANNGFESPDLGSGGISYAPSSASASWTFYSDGAPGQGGAGIAANNSAFDVFNATNGNHDGTTSTEGQAAFIQGGNGTTVEGMPDGDGE